MTKYEQLLDEANKKNITVIENYDFTGTQLKGLYCDSVIAIGNTTTSDTERACILAEELGHHYTAVGNILDQSSVENRKQELYGKIWAYNNQIGLTGLINAYKNHCQSAHEVSEYLGITDEFLNDALTYYRSKYGRCTQIDNYVIFFEPNIAIMELI